MFFTWASRIPLCSAGKCTSTSIYLRVFIHLFFLSREGGLGRATSRVKDIRNYIKTSEAKNSQVTAQKLRDLVAGDSSFHSLLVTPSLRPAISLCHSPPASLHVLSNPTHLLYHPVLQLLTRYFFRHSCVTLLLQLRHPAPGVSLLIMVGSTFVPFPLLLPPSLPPFLPPSLGHTV